MRRLAGSEKLAVSGTSFSFPLPFILQNHTTNSFCPYSKPLRIPSGKLSGGPVQLRAP
jgi:hypothetical protein